MPHYPAHLLMGVAASCRDALRLERHPQPAGQAEAQALDFSSHRLRRAARRIRGPPGARRDGGDRCRVADPPVRAPRAHRGRHQPAGHRADQPPQVGPRPRPVPRDRPGRDCHRRPDHRRDVRLQGAVADDVGGRSRGGGLRSAGDARECVCRPLHPERAAVQGGPLDSRRRFRRAGRRNHLARDPAADQVRQLHRRSEQHHRQGSDHQLFGAGSPDAAGAGGRCQLCRLARGRETGHARSDDAVAIRSDVAGSRCAARRLRRVRDELPGAVLGGRLRAGRGGARRREGGDLLRLCAPRHRDSVSDPGRVLA